MDTGQILADILVGGELRIHLIGVAGSGMSGLAGLLMAIGHKVSGSDRASTIEIERLQKLGLQFSMPPDGDAVLHSDLVIFSSAVKPGNVDYDAAVRSGMSIVRRADALAAMLNCKLGIVVAGTHGKTTTSAMAAHVLRKGGLRPSHYVGAEIPILGTNAHWDTEGELFVAEGDESDGTLAMYRPEHALVLNIEEEHLDYYEDISSIKAVFSQFISQTRGHVFYCVDDANARQLCSSRPGAISFGAAQDAHYRSSNVEMRDLQCHFDVRRRGEFLGAITLNVPGLHNVSNALSVIALATELGIPFLEIARAMGSFAGAKRRFEIKYRSANYLVVDDYAHHPTEIRATLATAKTTARSRVVTIFQPHRYTRTAALSRQFGDVFGDADKIFVTEIYAASEPAIPGVSGQTIVDAIVRAGHRSAVFFPDRTQALFALGNQLLENDLVLSLGAGNIHEQSSKLAQDLATMEKLREVLGAGAIKLYEPLASHTTLRVGGPAQFWAEPETVEGFANLVGYCSAAALPLLIMGRGSNLLVRDGGIPGVVAHLTRGEFRKVSVNGTEITAGVGLKLKELSYVARDAQLGGFEWMEGIPGNVGGGLRMNAGAMGGETFDNVLSVRCVDSAGNVATRAAAELEVHYRDVPSLKNSYAVAATFRGAPSTREEITKLLDKSMQKRRSTQPAASSAGCIFKNTDGCPAGKLVDELGLKNLSVGAARVSEVHGNFIVNDGGASARDMLELIEKIKAIARSQRGIELQTEVQIVGEPG